MTGAGLGLATLCGTLALLLAAPAQAVNRQVFPDPAGESGGAPDVTQIQVSNDDQGALTFALTVGGQPSLRAGDSVFVDVDADRNVATGAPNTNGADYLLNIFIESGSLYTYKVCRWSGSWDCTLKGRWSDRAATASSHLLTLSLELPAKASRTIRFWIQTWSNRTVFDYAPDAAQSGAVFSYEQKLTPDFDRDGLRGAADTCGRVAAGRFDRDKDGCPGPFPALPKPDFHFRGNAFPSYVKLRFFQVRNAPPRTTVTVSFEGRQVTRQGNGRIPVLANRPLSFGTKIRIIFARPGWTGRYLDIRVGRSGPRGVQGGCIGSETSSPIRCP